MMSFRNVWRTHPVIQDEKGVRRAIIRHARKGYSRFSTLGSTTVPLGRTATKYIWRRGPLTKMTLAKRYRVGVIPVSQCAVRLSIAGKLGVAVSILACRDRAANAIILL
jgi:hypothetical protein